VAPDPLDPLVVGDRARLLQQPSYLAITVAAAEAREIIMTTDQMAPSMRRAQKTHDSRSNAFRECLVTLRGEVGVLSVIE